MSTSYITTAIPYVNAAPHLGHALEQIQADILARHRRLRGDEVTLLAGSDDHAGKNASAAAAAGRDTAEFVAEGSARFRELRELLDLSWDDFVATSADPRHRRAVEELFVRAQQGGWITARSYEGLYCEGCECFLEESELEGGCCVEHHRAPVPVSESNWFFDLAPFQQRIEEALTSGEIEVLPAQRLPELLGFLRSGLRPLSVSRPRKRSGGFGIEVPGDPSQIIYVWFDALANYLAALGFGGGPGGGFDPDRAHFWSNEATQTLVIGKGITRFHGVYLTAFLLAADLPLPRRIAVHDYLTLEGEKIAKSRGNTVSPREVVDAVGLDALRWWCAREVALLSETDVRLDRLRAKAEEDLVNGVGNLVSRVTALVRQFQGGALHAPSCPTAGAAQHLQAAGLWELARTLPQRVDEALAAFDLRTGAAAVGEVVDGANALVSASAPWLLGRQAREGDANAACELAALLDDLVGVCRLVSRELSPFLPGGAARLAHALGSGDSVGEALHAFPRQ